MDEKDHLREPVNNTELEGGNPVTKSTERWDQGRGEIGIGHISPEGGRRDGLTWQQREQDETKSWTTLIRDCHKNCA